MINIIIKIIIIILVLDFLFINLTYKNFNNLIKKIQGSELNLNINGAILSYLCVVFILYYFIIKDNRTVNDAFILGVCTYGIFEFTNIALFKDWSLMIALIDILWGGTLFGLTTFILQNKII
jgi:uncharacterized membrane protein